MEIREHKNDLNPLGVFIRESRKKRGVTARQVSEALHMHPSYISRIEEGKLKKPSLEKLYRIADYLKLNYSDLCSLADYRMPRLPNLPGYLRVKYEMSDDDIHRLTEYFELLQAQHGIIEKVYPGADVNEFELSGEMKRMQDEGILKV